MNLLGYGSSFDIGWTMDGVDAGLTRARPAGCRVRRGRRAGGRNA